MTDPLFTPYQLGDNTLPNRIVMAPMTRARTTQPGDIPNEMMAAYYAQRASTGLIISEATQISPQGKGYSFTPGIFTPEQIKGWKTVTSKVHEAGGRIFSQLWHVGRMSHESFHEDGKPVAPSALSPDAQVWVVNPDTGVGEMVDCPTPRALEREEIKQIEQDYVQAARNAIEAGFDGVEIHGANGYLIDQFLRQTSNQRSDDYGGSQENRIRFLINIAAAVSEEIGAHSVGVRLSPFITQRNMNDPEIIDTMLKAAVELEKLGISYIHLSEADWDDAPTIPESFRHDLRAVYSGTIIVAGKYTKERGNKILTDKLADLVAFGRPFIANPDLPYRLQHQLDLSPLDGDTLFGGTDKGYTDYPALQK